MINRLNIKAQCMRLGLVCCALFFSLCGWGQVQWGPNALPVIDMSSGETTENLSVEVSVSYYNGHKGEESITPNLRLNIPLFTRWVNLEAWYSVMDFYSRYETRDTRYETNWHNVAEDIYVSTNIQVLHGDWFKRKYIPVATARIGIKTASGGGAEYGRFIDAPGYFLDLTIAEKIKFIDSWAKSFSFGGAIGFYCWQTGQAEQNDAYMYGIRGEFEARYLRLSAEWGGYTGWQKNGDQPMTLKTKLGIPCKWGFEPYLAYQYGLRDYPYHEFRVGVRYSIDVVK